MECRKKKLNPELEETDFKELVMARLSWRGRTILALP